MKFKFLYNIGIFLVVCLLPFLFSCKQKYTPKPIGYARIDFPQKEYQRYDSNCPYSFEYPNYGIIDPNPPKSNEPCWININFPNYNGTIHLSYKKINNNLPEYIEDSRTLAYKHTVKADAIYEKVYKDTLHDVYGIVYNIKGNVASSVQFFATDSIRHFLRGSLYFKTEPNIDSLSPVISYFKKDVIHLIETLEWKNN